MNLTVWALPAMSLVSVVAWVVVLRRSVHLMALGHRAPDWAVVGLLVLVTLTSFLLLVSSFAYPGVLDTDGARFVVSVLRVAVFTAGVLAWAALRHRRA